MADVTLRRQLERGISERCPGSAMYIEEIRRPRAAGRSAGNGLFWNVVFAVLCLLVLVCVFYR